MLESCVEQKAEQIPVQITGPKQALINRYLQAKDHNRPHLMAAVFSESAQLTMKVKSGEVVFPAATVGLNAITDVLVREFNQRFENIYSRVLRDSVQEENGVLSCRWLVVMSEKQQRLVCVGGGEYRWQFNDAKPLRVSRLGIQIEQMIRLQPTLSDALMAWPQSLSDPWCDTFKALTNMPELPQLIPLREYLAAAPTLTN